MTKEYGEGVKVYSIFKRKKDAIDDANPLLYTLNGDTNQRHNSKRSWTFKTNKDRNAVHRQIHNYNTIIEWSQQVYCRNNEAKIERDTTY